MTCQNLSHTRWDCKYHVVFIPKFRWKVQYKQLKKYLGEVFKDFAQQKESKIEEGYLMPDHIHMLISIPPKYAEVQVVGFLKGKSAVHIERNYLGRMKNYGRQHFWTRGYLVSIVGKAEAKIRKYIQDQEKEVKRIDQMNLLEGNY